MISLSERITVETPSITSEQMSKLQGLEHITAASYEEGLLIITSEKKTNNITEVLNFLQSEKIPYNRVITELPTLNDVFLELTGKQLRD